MAKTTFISNTANSTQILSMTVNPTWTVWTTIPRPSRSLDYNALVKSVPSYIGADGLHPTTLGYAKIAETFFTSIQESLDVKASPAPGASLSPAPCCR